MSDAKVIFTKTDQESAGAGEEQMFSFACPKARGRDQRCGLLLIAGKTATPRDGQNKNGGAAQWEWDGDRTQPTFKPSINCVGCWHGYIERGRCLDGAKGDEPEPR